MFDRLQRSVTPSTTQLAVGLSTFATDRDDRGLEQDKRLFFLDSKIVQIVEAGHRALVEYIVDAIELLGVIQDFIGQLNQTDPCSTVEVIATRHIALYGSFEVGMPCNEIVNPRSDLGVEGFERVVFVCHVEGPIMLKVLAQGFSEAICFLLSASEYGRDIVVWTGQEETRQTAAHTNLRLVHGRA